MKFPYGNADFYDVITSGYFYVDRTGYIPVIEDFGKTLLLLRPRRFGKSLLLSMLENYYDVAKADDFERLFGYLAVGQTPTSRHNQYLILKWNFSVVATQGSIREIKRALHDHLNDELKAFARRYQAILPFDIEFDADNALSSLSSTLTAARATPYNIYVLIDEYDNFANEVLMAGQRDSQQRYEALIQGEGLLKTLFKAVKYGTEGQGIDRVFVTGVSPVVMSDITSGFNVAKDISLEPEFNDLCGFWEHEIAAILRQIADECASPPRKAAADAAEALEMMRKFYDGYSFTYDEGNTLYNPTMALYFMDHFQRRCQYPRRILDSNLAMDRGKIAYVAALPHGERVVTAALDVQQPLALATLSERFGVREVLQATHDQTFMISLLYYFGVLTLTGERNEYGELTLRIPNLVIQRLYVERIREMLLPDTGVRDEAQRIASQLYQKGLMQPLCDFMEQTYFKVFDNRDYRWTNELTIKTLFLSLLFNDTFYIMDSEPALRRDYADLVMIVRPDMREYELLDILIEFKYVGLGENDLTGEQVRTMDEDDLRALPAVRQAFAAARSKLTGYRETLHEVYGEKLHLRTYAVVAIGFDRLVWEEVA
jgi:hypothetical protein